MTEKMLFDDWPEMYEKWFATPIGQLVYESELSLTLQMLNPRLGEKMLDAGCGTGYFTLDFLKSGAQIFGLDISQPMLKLACRKAAGLSFQAVRGNMLSLPFRDAAFDKTVSITALEFIADGQRAVDELFRVTRPGGRVVVATLNSLSPWAERRRKKAEDHILENACYRSPEELLAFSKYPGQAATAVFFGNSEDPDRARMIEETGRAQRLETGAFVVASWKKPDQITKVEKV